MPHKTSGKENKTPPVILRRSPRFQQIVLADPVHPKTPNPELHRRTRSHSSATPLSLTGKKKVSPRRRSHRSNLKQCSQKVNESCNSRLNLCADECNAETLPPGSDWGNRKLEKRVTRSSCRRDLDTTSYGCSSGEWIVEKSVNISKQSNAKSQKKKVKYSKKNGEDKYESPQFDTLLYDDKISERLLSIGENQVLDKELCNYDGDGDKVQDQVAVNTAVVVQEGPVYARGISKKQKNIGAKRTRNQFENTQGITQGWTKDQELALERAYLAAKPTPHFWKKVSRMVPGKSAQECFDKIHGSHLTPPQPQMRSRARVSNSQNPSFSASKLLNTSSPTTKRPKSRKQKSHVVQRTVRHMLQNQYKAGQDSSSDVFSLLEPTFIPSLNLNLMLTTPDRNQETDDVQQRSSTVRRSVSRFSSSHESVLVSPPVLKPVKNKALHEKYIDLLNCREANRKAASTRAEKLNKSKVMKQEGSAERKNALKAAKNALVFGAKDAIDEFQHQQATALNDLFDYESGADTDEENG